MNGTTAARRAPPARRPPPAPPAARRARPDPLNALLARIESLKKRDLVGALRLAEEAEMQARRAGRASEQVEALLLQSYALLYLMRLPEAMAAAARAHALARAAGDAAGEAHAAFRTGQIANFSGQFAKALAFFERCRLCARRLPAGHPRREWLAGESWRLTAVVRQQQGRHEESARALAQALACARRDRDRRQVANIEMNAGLLAAETGRFSRAIRLLHAAERWFAVAGETASLAYVRVNLSDILLRAGQPEAALASATAALPLVRRSRNTRLRIMAHLNAGAAALSLGRRWRAALHLRWGLAMSRQTGERRFVMEARRLLAAHAEATGDVAAARRHWREAIALAGALGLDAERERFAGALARLR